MKKREFLKTSGVVLAGGALIPAIISCQSGEKKEVKEPAIGKLELPSLDYDYNALEPYVDAKTMTIHHGKHHNGYTTKANKAIEEGKWLEKTRSEILDLCDDTNIFLRNNFGGYINHSLYWKNMTPGGKKPNDEIMARLEESFGGFSNFESEFKQAALSVFGSGWAWLSLDDAGSLFISATENQDNPAMRKVVEKPGKPILGIDVWEHAYYLKHKNKRPDYINAFLTVVNWDNVLANYTSLK